MSETTLISSLQSRKFQVLRCGITAGSALLEDGETRFNTQIAYDIKPYDAPDDNQSKSHWYSIIRLSIKCEALNEKSELRYEIIYESSCEYRHPQGEASMTYDNFLMQTERIGIVMLVTNARAHLLGAVGLLGYPDPYTLPMIDVSALIKAHHSLNTDDKKE